MKLLILIMVIMTSSCKKVEKVAKVGNEFITKQELENELSMYNDEYYKTEEGRKEVIDGLITKKILYMEARKLRLSKENEEKLNKFIDRYKRQLNKFIDDYKLELLIEKLKQEEWKVTKEDIENFAKNNKYYRFSHILVADYEKALTIYELLKNSSRDFEKIARLNSIDEATSKKGGDLGYIIKGQLPKKLDFIFELREGEISKPVRTSNGWHIFMKTGEKNLDVKKDSETIKNAIMVLKMNDYIDKKKKEYKVKHL
ncbi:MAG: peptidylprolyl isomerase [bacterium]|nr:peptidylprolyl isomerase [bacterium]